jgi:hypothetical protein
MTRQEARAAARKLSRNWTDSRLGGSRAKRKELAKQIAKRNWRALLSASSFARSGPMELGMPLSSEASTK